MKLCSSYKSRSLESEKHDYAELHQFCLESPLAITGTPAEKCAEKTEYAFLPANVIIDIILRRIYTYRLKGAGTGHFCGIAYQWQ